MKDSPGLTPLITTTQIRKRIAVLAGQISHDFDSREPLMIVSILKGSFMFTADLVRALSIPCTIDFLQASSYGTRRSSSGTVAITGSLTVKGRHVLLVEDIIDTGLTINRIVDHLRLQQPSSIRICNLLDKPAARRFPCTPDYTGFRIDNIFVAGYGLDDRERYRELPCIVAVER